MTPGITGIKLSASLAVVDAASEYETERYLLARELTRLVADRANHLYERMQVMTARMALQRALPELSVSTGAGQVPVESAFDPLSESKLTALDSFMASNWGMLGGSAQAGEEWAALMRTAGLPVPEKSWPVLVVTRTVTLDNFTLAPLAGTEQASRQFQWLGESDRANVPQGKIYYPMGSGLQQYSVHTLDMPQDDISGSPTSTTVTSYCLDRYAGFRLSDAQLQQVREAISGASLADLVLLRKEAESLGGQAGPLLAVVDDGAGQRKAMREQESEVQADTHDEDRRLVRLDQRRERDRNREAGLGLWAGTREAASPAGAGKDDLAADPQFPGKGRPR